MNTIYKYRPGFGTLSPKLHFKKESSTTTFRPKIVLLFMGEDHRDPGPTGLMHSYIKAFHQLSIKQIFCPEISHIHTKEQEKESAHNYAKKSAVLLDFKEIKGLMTRNPELSFPYFPSNADKEIREIFSKLFLGIGTEELALITNQAVTYLHDLECIQLNQQLENLKIPFQGIERDEEEHRELFSNLLQSGNQLAAVHAAEKLRIQQMTKNLFDKAFPHINASGGIIWVNPGAMHTHNLAVSVLNHIEENDLNDLYSFKLIPTICQSPYITNDKNAFLARLEGAKQALNEKKMLPLFDEIPLHIIRDVKEIKAHHFESLVFDKLMSEVKSYLKTSPRM
jgi:hypothetical protein